MTRSADSGRLAAETPARIIVILPERAFVGRAGFSQRVDLEYELENEVGTWSSERCAAGSIVSVGAAPLPENSFVFKLQPSGAKEVKVIRRLFYRLAIQLGLIGIAYLHVNAEGLAANEPFVRRGGVAA